MKRLIFPALLGLALALMIWLPAARADRLTITDLPPGIVNGYKPTIDLIIHTAPAADTILQVCHEFHAACAVSGVPAAAVGFTCRGDSAVCWRQFIHSLKLAGVAVRVGFRAGGASYVFWQTGGALAEGNATAGRAGVRQRPAAGAASRRSSGGAAGGGGSSGGGGGGSAGAGSAAVK